MTISKPYLTFIANLTLAIIGSIAAYLTDVMILLPIVFALGAPLINIDKQLKEKAGLTFVIIIASLAIFIATIIAVIGLDFGKYIFPGISVGVAGVLFLGINALLIDSIKFSLKTAILTFLLSGLSLPIWIILTENILPTKMANAELIRQSGVMLFWMTMTTIGICISIKNKKLPIL
ncbi:MAG: hypothetical protein ABI184_06955 [Ginsengibacter sp.]